MPDRPFQAVPVGELFKLYEDGKHRRYTLLFAINGGAFAVAKFLTHDCSTPAIVLGALRLWQLSLVMVMMTAVLVWDIFTFGTRMSQALEGNVFTATGKWVLIFLGGMIILGWSFAGFVPGPL